ncbi:MAG TPA: hypothetical protein PLU30_06615 [Verrucomicrobiae bacterium]|nr:hypothetical protein [Verrucomicrobiae bacterium]
MAESGRREEIHPVERVGKEMAAMPQEPLLPVEKKLIGWSLMLGVVLLGILIWVSLKFFPA